MTMNPPRSLRIALYVLNILGTPVVVYARAKGWIGDLELALWGAEVAAAMTLAGLNVSSGHPAPVTIEPAGDVVVAPLVEPEDKGLIYGDERGASLIDLAFATLLIVVAIYVLVRLLG